MWAFDEWGLFSCGPHGGRGWGRCVGLAGLALLFRRDVVERWLAASAPAGPGSASSPEAPLRSRSVVDLRLVGAFGRSAGQRQGETLGLVSFKGLGWRSLSPPCFRSVEVRTPCSSSLFSSRSSSTFLGPVDCRIQWRWVCLGRSGFVWWGGGRGGAAIVQAPFADGAPLALARRPARRCVRGCVSRWPALPRCCSVLSGGRRVWVTVRSCHAAATCSMECPRGCAGPCRWLLSHFIGLVVLTF